MHTPPILTKIQQCKQFLGAGLIESSGKTIQDIFTLAADIASKEVDSNPKPTKKTNCKHRKPNKKWYDQECKILKKHVNNLANKRNKQPLNQEIKLRHKNALKEYKMICSSRKHKFWKNEIIKPAKPDKTQ